MPARFKSRGLKAVIGRWMDIIQMPMTNLRELFICRYTALLMLRGVRSDDPRCLKSAMEVLLNLSHHPQRQASYLRSVNRNLQQEIDESNRLTQLPANHGTVWQCPGHVGPPGVENQYHFAVLPDFPVDGPLPRMDLSHLLHHGSAPEPRPVQGPVQGPRPVQGPDPGPFDVEDMVVVL